MGFKVVPGLLADCGLPDVRLWYSTVKRGAHTLPTVKAILHEIGEVRNMRKQNPGEWSSGVQYGKVKCADIFRRFHESTNLSAIMTPSIFAGILSRIPNPSGVRLEDAVKYA